MGRDSEGNRFRILGPVEVVTAGGPIAFGRRQHRDLIAYLLLNAGRLVSAEHLVDAMWGGGMPATGRAQLRNMVSAVRAALVTDSGTLATIERQPGGYRWRIVDATSDLDRFDEFVALARDASTPAAAARSLRAALNQWHGPSALGGVHAAFVDVARAHLDERRATTVENLFDAELAAGRHLAIVAELMDAVAAQPARERLVAQLMTALYRSGRQPEALRVYRDTRLLLTDDYGLEPGADLRDLERRILTGDPALHGPGPPPTSVERMQPSAIRVLVVDDQALLRAGLVSLLRAAPGIDVVGDAADGAEAIHLAEATRPDVVLMDVRMPGTDGLTATERIVPIGPRVVVLTTFDFDEYVYRALRAGAHGFLLKDTPPDRLLAALSAVANGEMLFAPSVTRRLVQAYAQRPLVRADLSALTARERQVLRLVGTGMSNTDIAGRLVISETTVKIHVNRMMVKLGLTSRAQAVVVAYEAGLVEPAR